MKAEPCVYVVDRDKISWELVSRLGASMDVECACFADAEEFLTAYDGRRPGCLVTEFRLLGINGIDLQEQLASQGSSLPVVFLTGHAETRLTVQAMQNGALTVLTKPVSEQELWDTIRTALVRDAETRRIDAAHGSIRRRFERLSRREGRVLRGIMAGKANKTIAAELDVSVRTVEACRQRIFRQTQTDSVAELIRLVLEFGVDLDSL
jgi:FixJ family two-component response regulator